MIHVSKMSGEEFATIRTEEVADVRRLKRLLRNRYSIPLSLQQLLHNGRSLEDDNVLNAPIDLQLVLLPVSTDFQRFEASDELVEACKHGLIEVARMLVDAGGETQLMRFLL